MREGSRNRGCPVNAARRCHQGVAGGGCGGGIRRTGAAGGGRSGREFVEGACHERSDSRGRSGRTGGRRGGGGAARRAERTAPRVEAAPFIRRRIPNYEILDEEGLALIEANAETVLEETGVRFADNPAALELWRGAGADVRGDRVHLPKGLARSLCATAPREYVQHARNPERSVTIGGKSLVLAPVYGPPFVRDMERGRRYATIEDFRNFVKLAYMSQWVHHSGGTVCEPTDVAVNKRHLDMLLAHMTLSDKPFMGSVTEAPRAADSVEMCRILFGDGWGRTAS